MWLPFPLPGCARAPDGPDSPSLGLGAAAEARSGRASRRVDSLSRADFAEWLDARPFARSGGALLVLRLRQPSSDALDALAAASVRAVRPNDRVGHAGAAAIAIWLEGMPPHLTDMRADRLRLSLQRQGAPEFDLAALPVAAGNGRSASELLAIAAGHVGSLEHIPS